MRKAELIDPVFLFTTFLLCSARVRGFPIGVYLDRDAFPGVDGFALGYIIRTNGLPRSRTPSEEEGPGR